jgi:hypothetical protein
VLWRRLEGFEALLGTLAVVVAAIAPFESAAAPAVSHLGLSRVTSGLSNSMSWTWRDMVNIDAERRSSRR